MKVILTKNVNNLGQAGEIKEVKEGYAINFLIPSGSVVVATPKNLLDHKNKIASITKQKNKKVLQKKKVAKGLNKHNINIKLKADEQGHLYGSVNAKLLVKLLKNEGHKVDVADIILEEPIKTVGKHSVKIKAEDRESVLFVTISKE